MVKSGFEVYLQTDLSEIEKATALKFVNQEFISKTCADSKFRYFGTTGGGYTSGLWRGRYGIVLENGLVFRRISKSIRKFAVVKADTLEAFNDSFLDKAHSAYRDLVPDGPIGTHCNCPRHCGSIKVRFKKTPTLELYAKVGDCKG